MFVEAAYDPAYVPTQMRTRERTRLESTSPGAGLRRVVGGRRGSGPRARAADPSHCSSYLRSACRMPLGTRSSTATKAATEKSAATLSEPPMP
jgi:hypothetical protein